jgi:hypothetical protein
MATNKSIKTYLKGIPFTGLLYISLILDALVIVSVFFAKNLLPPVVPLFYGRPSGEGQLVPVLGLLLAPLVSLAITFANFFLAKIIKVEFLQKILIVSTFLLTLLTTITVIKIILLVGFF